MLHIVNLRLASYEDALKVRYSEIRTAEYNLNNLQENARCYRYIKEEVVKFIRLVMAIYWQ